VADLLACSAKCLDVSQKFKVTKSLHEHHDPEPHTHMHTYIQTLRINITNPSRERNNGYLTS
jgi:hypothetical protein